MPAPVLSVVLGASLATNWLSVSQGVYRGHCDCPVNGAPYVFVHMVGTVGTNVLAPGGEVLGFLPAVPPLLVSTNVLVGRQVDYTPPLPSSVPVPSSSSPPKIPPKKSAVP